MTNAADYGGEPPVASGGRILAVDPASPAGRAGLQPGDRVLGADGHPLADVLDWQWFSDGPSVVADVERDGVRRSVAMERDPGESWGIEFETALFDGVRTCRNACAFCFMTQLPKGLRRSLYVRDDDFRLSFMQGNFVSLTNLSDPDVERIAEQHLSPLHFSLHAVTPEVRARLVCARDDRALERADQLLDAGIDLHAQIVLVPGVNDGEELTASLTWLAERDGVRSVGVVPLGYTGHQHAFDRSYEDADAASAVIDQVSPWHDAMRETYGTGWAYLADEFYLAAKRPIPVAEDYDDFPQFENGIGMVRTFVDGIAEQADVLRDVRERLLGARTDVVVVTGVLFAPVLDESLGEGFRVLPAENRFFGGNVSVAGLLTAEDLVAAIRDDAQAAAGFSAGERRAYLVPDVVLNADGVTLDDVSGSELGTLSGQEVRLVSSDARGLAEALFALAQDV